MASAQRPPPRATWTMADPFPISPPCCPLAPPRCPAWHCSRLSESMKGLLVALFGGGVPAGFVAPFARKAEASGIPSLEILLFRCVLHLLFICRICWRKAHCCGPPEARRHTLLHASINVISVGCAYSSFMVVPSGNATTVRKGSSTICSVLLALCLEKSRLTGYDWFGLVGSTVGLLIMVIPDLMILDKSTLLHDSLGYVWACLGGLSLAIGLIIFRALDFPGKLGTAAFLFGGVGSLVCSPMMFLLQDPVMPMDPLAWASLVAICLLALVSFLCSSYAVTKAHPALVCAVLHSEVVVTLAVQYCVLREAVTPFAVIGAGVILGSIAIITAQKISCHALEDSEGGR